MGDGLSATASDGVRVVAIDWSGRRIGAQHTIWLAEARAGVLVRLENGRSREQVAEHLLELADRDPRLVVGLDFSFSLPAWFLRERGYSSAPALWDAATTTCEAWLTDVQPPFWGTRGHVRPELPAHLRVTESSLAVGGISPKSTFQVSGAGSVGTGSLRGFPVLAHLRAGGFAVWPFDDAVPPVAFEVWPRLLTGPVVKTSIDARSAYLDHHLAMLPRELRDLAVGSDDAFDAAVSAVVMAHHVDDLVGRPQAVDAMTRLEGAVWYPSTP